MIFDIVTVGHFSIDSILLPNRKAPFVILGGSPAYVSLAARRLDARVAIISKVGCDFPEAYKWWLTQDGVDLSGLSRTENGESTHFELEYNSDLSDRVFRLKSKAPPITIDDLPKSLKANVVHVAPIAGEIGYEVVENLRKCGDVLSLDPQGLVRNFDENGNTALRFLDDRRVLELVDIYKSSLNEIKIITGMPDGASAMKVVHDFGAKIVIVTLGADGTIFSTGDVVYNLPMCTPEKFVDPTGAGDAFAGGFLAEYTRGENLLRCACVGSAAASFVVEGIGPTFFGEKEQIYQRAKELYEKEIRE